MTTTNVKTVRKCEFNNYIVGQRSIVKQAVNHTINKLMRDADRLRRKKTVNDLHKEKNQRRADRYIEELKYIKLNSSIEERALTILSEYKLIQPAIKKFREEHPNWINEVPDIIKSLGVNYRKKRLKSLAAKGKLDPVMEKERKLFLLLHKAAGLDLDPKMLESNKSVISLNKKKKVSNKEPKANDKKIVSPDEGNSDASYESEDINCEERESEEDDAEKNSEPEVADCDATDSEEDDAEQNSEPEVADCDATDSEEEDAEQNSEPEVADCDATDSEEDDAIQNRESEEVDCDPTDSEEGDEEQISEPEDVEENIEPENVGSDSVTSEEEDAEGNSDSETPDCGVTVSKNDAVKETNFETLNKKRDPKGKIKLLKPKSIIGKKGQKIFPLVNRPKTNQCVANKEKDIKSKTKRTELSQSDIIDKKLENRNKKVSKKLKLLQCLESKTSKNMQNSIYQNEKGVIDSIFSNIDELKFKDHKKCNLVNANSNSFKKAPPLISYTKGTCKVKQINLENEADLLKEPLNAVLPKNDNNISSDDENYTNNHESSNLKTKRSSFFVGNNRKDIDFNNEDDDKNIRKKKVSKLQTYENGSSFFTSGLSNDKNENLHGNQKQPPNDGLNRYERRRQKFGPLEHRGEKRAYNNKDDFVDDQTLEATSHKRGKSDFGKWNNNQKNDKTNGNRGGAKRKFNGRNRSSSFPNSGSNNIPLGNRQSTIANKAPQESLLHPSWAAKKKEASLSSALHAFQGKKITFDD